MAIVLAQTPAHANNASNIGTSVAVTLGANCTAGNFLAIGVTIASTAPGITSVTGNSNIYPLAVTSAVNASTSIYYAMNINAGSTTVTVNYTTGAAACIFAYEYSGILTSGALDRTKGASSSANPATTGNSSVTTRGNELLFGAIGAATNATWTAGVGYGNFTTDAESIFAGGAAEDQIVNGEAAYAATFVNSGGAASDVVLATFIAAPAIHNLGFNTNNLRPHAFSPGLAR